MQLTSKTSVYEFMYWGRERERMIKSNVKNW